MTLVRFTRPASAPRSPEWSCEKNEFCETNVRGKVRADWSQKNGARIFLTGDFVAVVEVDFLELQQARERAEVA